MKQEPFCALVKQATGEDGKQVKKKLMNDTHTNESKLGDSGRDSSGQKAETNFVELAMESRRRQLYNGQFNGEMLFTLIGYLSYSAEKGDTTAREALQYIESKMHAFEKDRPNGPHLW